MSEDAEWDPLHWLKAKELSLERKAAAVAAASAQPGDAFLIVTEGTVTEPVYFELLLGALELSRVWVRVMPGDHSDPRHVIRTADRIALEQQRKAEKKLLGIGEPEDFDHVWAVIDTDVAVRDGIWNDVQQLAAARAVTLAHSTPCFEFWLLLHLVEHATTRGDLQNGDAAKAAVKKALGREYSTNEETAREAIGFFIGEWPKAVVHAELVCRQHETAATPTPANPSTEVDRLVRALNDSAPEHLRKL